MSECAVLQKATKIHGCAAFIDESFSNFLRVSYTQTHWTIRISEESVKDLERPDSKTLFPCVMNALHCNKTVNKLVQYSGGIFY